MPLIVSMNIVSVHKPRNTLTSMLITVLLIGFKNANSVQELVSTERVVFYKENSAGMYSSLAYTIGQASDFFFTFIYNHKFYLTSFCCKHLKPPRVVADTISFKSNKQNMS